MQTFEERRELIEAEAEKVAGGKRRFDPKKDLTEEEQKELEELQKRLARED